MCSSHPTIGITVSARAGAIPPAPGTSTALYVAAVEAHGARAVLLRPGDEVSVEGLDGLMLAGGGDVDPGWYWESRHPLLGEVDHDRDVVEFALVRQALRASLPILGICRGAQVLGVALGGTLHQDIGACVRQALAHATVGDTPATHRVKVAESCLLRQVLGQAEVMTNSFHHQANAHLGPRVRAVAWAADGVIEAIEATGGFVVGVQWHPERMVGEDAAQVRLFSSFVEESRSRSGRVSGFGLRVSGRATAET